MKKSVFAMFSAAVLALAAMGSANQTISFQAVFGDEPAVCGQNYEGIGRQGSTVTLQDLRFFVSNLRLLTADGNEVPLNVVDDGVWQHDGIVLLDFEDGTAGCSNAGNSATNTVVTAEVDADEAYTGLAFDVGVPFEWNHVDNTLAPSPLNLTPMFWSWQNGFKFMRVELVSLQGEERGFWPIHIGSTGCVAPVAVISPEEPCANTNVSQVQLDGFNPLQDAVIVDLKAMLTGVDVSQSLELAPPGCMSGVLDPDCAGLFGNLGIDLETGAAVSDSLMFRAAN